MKLQELLEKHKDKLCDGYFYRIELSYFEKDVDLHCWYKSAIYPVIKPLSELLFSTPFLSLLEWKIDASEKVWIHQYIKDERFIEGYSTYENYHKINLVLLNTDEERKSYLENNTI